MPAPQGIARFPGITYIKAATITVVQGIAPSICTITMLPQPNLIARQGTLVFQFGDGFQITWPDAKVDWATLTFTEGGRFWQVNIMDRRWKWRFGKISGVYNRWRDSFELEDGKGDPEQAASQLNVIDTTRTPKQLAELCFEAMGEEDFDASALPDEVRPPVEWEGVVPSHALADMLDELGCRLVLRQQDNKPVIVRVGEGADLPTDGVRDPSYTLDSAEAPDKIGVICGASRFNVDFQLEAVALDAPTSTFGESMPHTLDPLISPTGAFVKPLPKVSWAIDATDDAGGFKYGDIPWFMNVGNTALAGQDTSGLRELAQRSALRCYRIKTPVMIPGYGLVKKLEQIELEEEQVNRWIDQFEEKNLPAWVFGVWYDGMNDQKNTAQTLKPAPVFPVKIPPGTREVFYQRGFVIDTARRMVIFNEAVFRNKKADTSSTPDEVTLGPAKLVLRCACSVRDEKTLALVRHTRERETGLANPFGTKTQWLKREEIVLNHCAKYDESSYAQEIAGDSDPVQIVSVTTNEDKLVNKQCDHYIDAALRQYQNTESLMMNYPGLRRIELDGAICQVTYHVGEPFASTTACRNTEHLRMALSYNERRRIERQRKLEDEARKAAGPERARRAARDARRKGGKL